MYYIINLDNQIIAADSDFIRLLGLTTLQELTVKLAKEEIEIIELDNTLLEIKSDTGRLSLEQTRYPISTLLGRVILVKVLEKENTIEDEFTILPDKSSDKISILLTEDENSEDENTQNKKYPKNSYSFLIDESEVEEDSAAQEEAQKIALAQKIAQEAEAKRLAEEAEAKRLAEEEAKRIAQEAEAKRLAEEAEAKRLAEEEAKRIAQEAETKRLAEEAEAKRLAEEAEKATLDKEDESMDFLLDNDFIEDNDLNEESTATKEPDDSMSFLLDDDDDFLKDADSKEVEVETPATKEPDDSMSFLLDDDDDFLKDADSKEVEVETPVTEEPDDSMSFLLDDDDDFLKDANSKEVEVETPVTEEIDDLLSLDDSDNNDTTADQYTPISADEIDINIKELSENLGISEDDYKEFLNEFADKAVEAEESIRSNSDEQKKAISSLMHLTQMLQLSSVSNLLEEIEKRSGDDEKSAIDIFYEVISKHTTVATSSVEAPEVSVEDSVSDENIMPSEETALPAKEDDSDNKICDLSFEGIEPIHFDFQMEKAAEDLSLPVDLIEEFVGDFIVQANEEKQTFIDACRRGDMDTIQKTGHKLKGVASNLRIVPLANTLEEVQFCEDKSRFEPLLKKYWGQFIAFEIFMNSILSNQGEK